MAETFCLIKDGKERTLDSIQGLSVRKLRPMVWDGKKYNKAQLLEILTTKKPRGKGAKKELRRLNALLAAERIKKTDALFIQKRDDRKEILKAKEEVEKLAEEVVKTKPSKKAKKKLKKARKEVKEIEKEVKQAKKEVKKEVKKPQKKLPPANVKELSLNREEKEFFDVSFDDIKASIEELFILLDETSENLLKTSSSKKNKYMIHMIEVMKSYLSEKITSFDPMEKKAPYIVLGEAIKKKARSMTTSYDNSKWLEYALRTEIEGGIDFDTTLEEDLDFLREIKYDFKDYVFDLMKNKDKRALSKAIESKALDIRDNYRQHDEVKEIVEEIEQYIKDNAEKYIVHTESLVDFDIEELLKLPENITHEIRGAPRKRRRYPKKKIM